MLSLVWVVFTSKSLMKSTGCPQNNTKLDQENTIIIAMIIRQVIGFIKKAMKNWKMELAAGVGDLAEEKIPRDIFNGD